MYIHIYIPGSVPDISQMDTFLRNRTKSVLGQNLVKPRLQLTLRPTPRPRTGPLYTHLQPNTRVATCPHAISHPLPLGQNLVESRLLLIPRIAPRPPLFWRLAFPRTHPTRVATLPHLNLRRHVAPLPRFIHRSDEAPSRQRRPSTGRNTIARCLLQASGLRVGGSGQFRAEGWGFRAVQG